MKFDEKRKKKRVCPSYAWGVYTCCGVIESLCFSESFLEGYELLVNIKGEASKLQSGRYR